MYFAQINAALLEHKTVVFKNKKLTDPKLLPGVVNQFHHKQKHS